MRLAFAAYQTLALSIKSLADTADICQAETSHVGTAQQSGVLHITGLGLTDVRRIGQI